MSKMKISKVFCVLLILMVFVSAGTVTKALSEEGISNNCKDEYFRWDYNGDGGDNGTREREKEDATSSYVRNSNSQTHIGCTVMTRQGNRDLIMGPYTYVRMGQAKYLTNYVYERGFRNALIRVCPDIHSPCYIGFWWSPDSV